MDLRLSHRRLDKLLSCRPWLRLYSALRLLWSLHHSGLSLHANVLRSILGLAVIRLAVLNSLAERHRTILCISHYGIPASAQRHISAGMPCRTSLHS